MDYYHLIEPYLYGTLDPEDEMAFERQLSRDPDLAQATSRRLNAGEALSGLFKPEPAPEEDPARQQSPSPFQTLFFIGAAVFMLGFFWLKNHS